MYLRGSWHNLTTCPWSTFSRNWHICLTLKIKLISSVVFSLLELGFCGRKAMRRSRTYTGLLVPRVEEHTVGNFFYHIHEEEATTDDKFCKREARVVGDDAGATTFHSL
jgi:hypothetical protein